MHPDRRLLLMVMVDALRHDYVTSQDAPFLSELARTGLAGRLLPSFGFEPDAAYLAGLYPDQCDGGAHYWYEPEAAPFRVARYMPVALDRLPLTAKKVLRRMLAEWMHRTTPYRHERAAFIPLEVLPYVAPAHKHALSEPGSTRYPTLFSLCIQAGIFWQCHAAPQHPVALAAGLMRLRRDLRPPTRFAYWHIGDLDAAGHRFGPGSSPVRSALRNVDAGLAEMAAQLHQVYDQVDWIVLGDHGMAEVRRTVDVSAALRQVGIRQGKGVWYFLDSTMARFWFEGDGPRSRIEALLNGLDGGKLLGPAELDRYHLHYPHNRFGDLLFLADPGVLILPNFFQDRRPVRGMHGYAPEFSEQQPAFIVSSACVTEPRRSDEPVDMRRVFTTGLALLQMEMPSEPGSLI